MKNILGSIICLIIFSYVLLFEKVSSLGKFFIIISLILIIFNLYKNLTKYIKHL